MNRKISARTLGQILAQYRELYPEEVAEQAADLSNEEGGDLLELLPPPAAWRLLEGLEPRTGARWLLAGDEAAIRRLLDAGAPAQVARIWSVAGQDLRGRVTELLGPAAAAKLASSQAAKPASTESSVKDGSQDADR